MDSDNVSRLLKIVQRREVVNLNEFQGIKNESSQNNIMKATFQLLQILQNDINNEDIIYELLKEKLMKSES